MDSSKIFRLKKYLSFSILLIFSLLSTALQSQTSQSKPKYYLQIKTDLLKRPSQLSEVEIDLFRIIFERLSNLREIELVNSLGEIDTLGQYDKYIFIIPRSLIMSPYIGRKDLANCYLEWKIDYSKVTWIAINIFQKQGRQNASLVYKRFIIPLPKNVYSATYLSTLQAEVENLFIELLSN